MAEQNLDDPLGTGQDDPNNLSPDKTPPGKPGQGEGQGDIDYGSLSDEEFKALLTQDEANALANMGLGDFKSYEQLVSEYKKIKSAGSLMFNQIKEVADGFGMKPDELVKHLQDQAKKVKGQPLPVDASKEVDEKIGAVSQTINTVTTRNDLNRLFDKYQAKMEKEGIEIPDSKQADLEDLIPAVIIKTSRKMTRQGKSPEEIRGYLSSRNPFELAHKLDLAETDESEDLEGEEERLAHRKLLAEKKKRQLNLPSNKRSVKVGSSAEKEEVWGDLSKL